MQITGDQEAYKQQRFIPHSLEAGGPRSRCRQVPCLLRATPWFTDSHLLVITLAAGAAACSRLCLPGTSCEPGSILVLEIR